MLVNIDFRDKRPLYEQVSSRLEELILRGVIGPDEALPSVRSLAVELSINPNTVQKAYGDLEQKGLIYSVSGRGSFAAGAQDILPKKKAEFLSELTELVKKGEALGFEKREMAEHIYPDSAQFSKKTGAEEAEK